MSGGNKLEFNQAKCLASLVMFMADSGQEPDRKLELFLVDGVILEAEISSFRTKTENETGELIKIDFKKKSG